MAEWSKAAVLKTADGASCPGVRIPSPPPTKTRKRWARCLWLRGAGGVHARPFPSVSTNPCGGGTTPSGNALKHVIYTFSRAGPLVRWPSVDLHANDEMTNSRRAVVTLRPFSAGEARTPNASPFLGRSSSESQLVTAPCHSLSPLHVTACHSFGEVQRYERFGSVAPRPTSRTGQKSASRLRSRCTVRRATLDNSFSASANVNEPPSSNAATRMP